MRTQIATVTSQGQITIPAAVRRLLGLEKGSRVEFVVGDDGCVTLRAPQWTLETIRGSLQPKTPMSVDMDDEIEQAIDEALAEKHPRVGPR